MAWTQAARDAAAMARKMHAGAKSSGKAKASKAKRADAANLVSPYIRSRLAKEVKAYRAGGSSRDNVLKLGHSGASLMTTVRASTALRNKGRK